MSILLRKEGIKANIKNCDSEEKVDLIVDAVNKILSRVVSYFDDYIIDFFITQ